MNGEFLTKIIGLKEPEFKMLTEFLLNHIMMGHDFQVRVGWSPGTIVLFDNRSVSRKSHRSLFQQTSLVIMTRLGHC